VYDLLAPHFDHHYGLLPLIGGIVLSAYHDSDYYHEKKCMDLYYRTKECIASKNYSIQCGPMTNFYTRGLRFMNTVCCRRRARKKLFSEMHFLQNMIHKNDCLIKDPVVHYSLAFSYFLEDKFKQCLHHSKAALKFRSENGVFKTNYRILSTMFNCYIRLGRKQDAEKCLKQMKKLKPVDEEIKFFNSIPDIFWTINSNNESPKFERNLRQCAYFYCENIESKKGEFKKCNACKVVYYCSKKCQKKHWNNGHKKQCNKLS